jgi:hypothetical protein
VVAKVTAYPLADGMQGVRGYEERLQTERAWQATWLVGRFGL